MAPALAVYSASVCKWTIIYKKYKKTTTLISRRMRDKFQRRTQILKKKKKSIKPKVKSSHSELSPPIDFQLQKRLKISKLWPSSRKRKFKANLKKLKLLMNKQCNTVRLPRNQKVINLFKKVLTSTITAIQTQVHDLMIIFFQLNLMKKVI